MKREKKVCRFAIQMQFLGIVYRLGRYEVLILFFNEIFSSHVVVMCHFLTFSKHSDEKKRGKKCKDHRDNPRGDNLICFYRESTKNCYKKRNFLCLSWGCSYEKFFKSIPRGENFNLSLNVLLCHCMSLYFRLCRYMSSYLMSVCVLLCPCMSPKFLEFKSAHPLAFFVGKTIQLRFKSL